MKTLAKLLYVEADEEITDLVDRLRDLSLEDEVTFVVPERARSLQSAMSFRLLKRYADSYGKKVNLVSPDPRLQAMALDAGFVAFPSMAAYDIGTEVHQPAAAEQSAPPAVIPPRPAAAIPPPAPSPASAPTFQRELSSAGVATLERPRQSPVTSAPPKKPGTPKLSSGPPLSVYRPYAIGAGVLISLLVLFAFLYLPTATATILVSGTAVKEDVTLNGSPGAQTGGDQFATQPITASQQVSLPGTPTGQKQVPPQAASGSVTFTENCVLFCQTGQLPIPSGTIVATSDGKQYQTTKAVNVATPRGSVSVGIAATTAGASGNTDAHTVNNIPNSQDDSLSVDNPTPISGGADARTATVIQQSDIDSVRDAYARDAVGQVQDQLNSKAQGKKMVPVGAGVQPTATADHKVGDEVGGFTVTVTVSGNGVIFDDSTVKQLLKQALQHKIPSGTQLTSNLKLTYEASNATADGHVTLSGHASGFYVPVYLQSNIRAHLKGMSPDKAHAFLQGLPNVVDARVTQSPFGLPWLPLFTSRISLVIQEVQSSSSS